MTCKNKFDHDSILHIVPTGANRIPHIIYLRRVAIFTKACSWTSCPNKQQKTTRPLLPSAASIRPAYVPLRHIIVYSMLTPQHFYK